VLRQAVLAACFGGLLLLPGCLQDGGGSPAPLLPASSRDPVPVLDGAAVLESVRAFSTEYSQRASNLPDHRGARDWIADEFASYGLEVWRQEFFEGIPQENIVGLKWGEVRDTWVIVGAHYDMVTVECGLVNRTNALTPGGVPDITNPTGMSTCVTRDQSAGAYDDASGMMLVMHLAKAFARVSTPYTIAFVAFDGEERGLSGSYALADALTDAATPYGAPDMRAMLDLDMFGLNFPGVDAPIYFDDNSQDLNAVVRAKAAALGIPDDQMVYHGIVLGRSDYDWFMSNGIPTAFFISNFERYQMPADIPANYPGTAADEAARNGAAYPFWHFADTYDTMILMAGSVGDAQAGFQTAADLSTAVLARMAMDATPLYADE
jgi:hypothetical protein